MIGIPYQGSKRKLAKPIIDYIIEHNPKAKYIYDLFGGGGSISFEALKRKQFKTVYYNEFNTGVVELLKKIRTDGVTSEFYNWIDRATFEKHKTDDTWFGGLLKTCWSFGNNQKDYLFGKDIEEPKRRMHEIVVNCCKDSLSWFNEKYGTEISELLFNLQGINERRLQFQKELSKVYDYQTKFKDIASVTGYSLSGFVNVVTNVEQLEKICIFDKNARNTHKQINRIEMLKKLGVEKQTICQNLNNIENLGYLEHLERLQISNLSYELVPITTPIDETIIYLDPPYKNTKKYQKDIDHDLFLEWVQKSKYKIYISSYDFDMPIVKEFSHRSTMSATANNKVVERLFCNQHELFKTTLF